MYKENEEMFFYKISRFEWSRLYSLESSEVLEAFNELEELRLISKCSPECKAIFDECCEACLNNTPLYLHREQLVHCAENC